MYKDLVHNFDYIVGITPIDRTATVTGSEIDLLGAIDVLIIVSIGAVAIADATKLFTFTVTQCATSGGTFAAAATTQYMVADSWDRIINATTEADAVKAFQFKPTLRYIKVVATETGAAQATFGAVVVYNKRSQPASS